MLDMEGQVDRFYRRLQARQNFLDEKKTREEGKSGVNMKIADLDLNSLSIHTWNKLGFEKVSDVLDKLKDGDKALLDLEGIGQSRLIEMKKVLRSIGIDVPGSED